MTREEINSCIRTLDMLKHLAYNVNGAMDVIDKENCDKIIKALEKDVSDICFGKWIPCDKGKPDPYRRVLMTERRPDWDGKEYRIVTLDSFCNHHGDVVAWMLPPEPFKDETEWETGEWIDDGDPLTLKCSKCSYVVKRYNNTNFCPNCGVKMK